jgi:hypothetical protein
MVWGCLPNWRRKTLMSNTDLISLITKANKRFDLDIPTTISEERYRQIVKEAAARIAEEERLEALEEEKKHSLWEQLPPS